MENEDEDAFTFLTLSVAAERVVKKLQKLAEIDREADDGACRENNQRHRAADQDERIVDVEHQRPTSSLSTGETFRSSVMDLGSSAGRNRCVPKPS